MTIDKITQSIYINGTWEPVDTDQTETIYNPATMEEITKVAYGGADETNRAIQAATDAFSTWSNLTGRERGRILYKAYELMMDRADHLAKVLTTEQGKPLDEAKAEVIGGANSLLWYAEEASRAYGELIPSSTKGKRMLRSEEHTSELQSRGHLVCRLLLEKKKLTPSTWTNPTQ